MKSLPNRVWRAGILLSFAGLCAGLPSAIAAPSQRIFSPAPATPSGTPQQQPINRSPGLVKESQSNNSTGPEDLFAPCLDEADLDQAAAQTVKPAAEPGATPDPKQPTGTGADPAQQKPDSEPRQTKRIFGILPNNRAVSRDTLLPPLSVKGKLHLALEDSTDYASFVNAGLLAIIGFSRQSTPEFHQGAAGFARYYWHSLADLGLGNFLGEGVMPVLTHEDPRYYTLGHGKFWRRVGYAASRIFVTRSDSGHDTFNFSEILGNGAGAVISNYYYPTGERSLGNTGKKMATQIGLDGISYILKEFWPEINKYLFHRR